MEFGFMEGAVNDICDSLENDPKRWTVTTYCLVDGRTGIEYWTSGGAASSITEVWNGHSRERVFSYEQGLRIRQSYNRMRETKASEAQAKVLCKTRPSKPMVTEVTDVKFKEIGGPKKKSWFGSFCDWFWLRTDA